MRGYIVDELDPKDVERIEEFLHRKNMSGSLSGIYYLPVPDAFLTDEQAAHKDSCAPFFMALETGDTWARLELLVRSRQKLRCSCIAYASPALREHMVNQLDAWIKDLDIAV